MVPAMDTLLIADNLHRRFPGREVVRGVDLRLRRGDILGLLGRNGAGKSTTMRMLAGALKPNQGRILVNGQPLLGHRATRAWIGYLPETPPLYPELRVDEYLRFAARLRGLPRARIRAAVESALEACELGARRACLCGQLSKGYRQRLGIAQAIVHQPRILILDEPANGLDPVQNLGLRALLRRLAENSAILLSSHLLAEVETLCNRVLVLHDGQPLFSSPLPLPAERRPLRLDAPNATPETLARVEGIESVEAENDGHFLLTLSDHGEPAAVNRALCEAGIEVRAFCPAGDALERLFAELENER